MRRIGWLAALCVGCSFQHGRTQASTDDATIDPDASSGEPDVLVIDGAVIGVDAAEPAINVIASENGGTLVSFTSEYCTPQNPPLLCSTGYWNRTNVHDGNHAMGDNTNAYRAAWASAQKANDNPEEFVFTFAGGASAQLERVVIQNWGRGNGGLLYYSTNIIVYGRPPGTAAWTMLLDQALATNETPQTFNLAAPMVVDGVRFSITDGQRTDYWEVGELEAWGRLQ